MGQAGSSSRTPEAHTSEAAAALLPHLHDVKVAGQDLIHVVGRQLHPLRHAGDQPALPLLLLRAGLPRCLLLPLLLH